MVKIIVDAINQIGHLLARSGKADEHFNYDYTVDVHDITRDLNNCYIKLMVKEGVVTISTKKAIKVSEFYKKLKDHGFKPIHVEFTENRITNFRVEKRGYLNEPKEVITYINGVVQIIPAKLSLVNLVRELLKDCEIDMPVIGGFSIHYPIKTPFGIVYRSKYLKSDELERTYPLRIFKHSKMSLNTAMVDYDPYTLGKQFAESDSSLMIVHGEPGSGKTKSVLQILRGMNEQTKMPIEGCICKDMENVEKVFTDAITDTSTVYVAILDDFDKLNNGNFTRDNKEVADVISFLLSISDSLIPITNFKLIVTSNRTINEIDKALLRPGRLFRRVEVIATNFNERYRDIEVPDEVKDKFKVTFDKDFDPDMKLTLAEWNFLINELNL